MLIRSETPADQRAIFDVTWVQRRRAKLEIDRAMMRQPGEKRVRVALGGAAPEAWCPEP